MIGSDWAGVSGVPGIGKAAITDETSHSHWDAENNGKNGKMNLKGRLSKMFQYKRSNIKQKDKELEANASSAVQKSALMEAALTTHELRTQPERMSAFCTQDPWKMDLRQTKSLYFPNFTHKPEFPELALPKLLKTVGTQTELYEDGHRKLRRIGTREDRESQTMMWIQGLEISEKITEPGMKVPRNMSDNSEDIFDQSCNLEVCEALSRGCLALQDAIQYKRRAEIYFNSASDVISPSSEMESENEDNTDTDDSDDDESVNIYEEALNCEDHPINRVRWAEHEGHPTYFHQSSHFRPDNNKVIEKKKLSRTANSNPTSGFILHSKSQRLSTKENIKSKFHGLKKSLSAKLSFFHKTTLYDF